MSCPTCNNSTGPVVVGGLSSILATVNAPCNTILCPSPQDAKCTVFTAGNLPCSGINTNDSLELALQKIDTLLCASSANYSSYNTYCLAPVTTQQSWVEKISQYVCNTQAALTTFTGTTFPAYQTAVTNALAALQVPGTTSSCSANTIINTDTIQTVLQKLSNSVCDIYSSKLSLSGVNWNSCYTVSPTPTTIVAGFNALIAQICSLQTSIGNATLPVFNNTGSCLPSPGSADTLVSTVNKIKTVLCAAPSFDINALAWNCVTKPSSTTTDLQNAFQAVLTKLDAISQALPNFSNQFSSAATDPSHPCAGVTVSLSTSLVDRQVAATTNDNTPGVLSNKLVGDGTTIQVDYSSVTQGIIKYIGASGGGQSNGKLLADVNDSTYDYLIGKVEPAPANNGLSIAITLDTSTNDHKAQFGINIDPVTLLTYLLNAISTDTTGALANLFCNTVNNCPSPCAAPTNISFIYGGTTSSSTTTTTTTVATTTSTSTTTTTHSTTTSSTTTTTTTAGGPTTTTTSTTSTTSSTTTTTTTLDTIYVGAQSSSTPPNAGTITGTGTTSSQNGANDVVADWTPFNASPQFTWVAIPNKGGTYTKNTWFQSVSNNGCIGGGSCAFSTPTTVVIGGQSYNVYMTNFATQWTGTVLMKN